MVHGIVNLEIVTDPAEIEKALSRPRASRSCALTTPAGQVLEITTNLGEMIGGAAAGARARWEQLNAAGGRPN
jgi:hypothetical protein